MDVDVRRCENTDEFESAIGAIGTYFNLERDAARTERFVKNLPLERMLAAWHDGAIVGGAGAFPFELTVPGATVACSGVTVVGVLPTHRRRGVLRAMMRAQLDEAHARGDPIAALWASEETIYGRFGYGVASWAGEIALAHEYAAFATPVERRGRLRLVDEAEALELFPPVYDVARRERPGMFARPQAWWEHRVLRQHESEPHPKRFVVLERDDDGVVAYAIYRIEPGWEGGVYDATLRVVEALAVTPDAFGGIWRFLLDVDWTARVVAGLLPPDHPLFLLLATPRRARYRRGDGLWVRIVDVGAALSARTYSDDEPLVLEVHDAFCPWNDARWRLADGHAEQTDEEADLRLDVDALGSAYLGGISFRQLADGLRIEELRDGAIGRADAAFGASLHPWCPEIF
jgi:predicted acetyltransferase